MPSTRPDDADNRLPARRYLKCLYVLNGCVATLAHYAVLRALLQLFPAAGAGVCNIGASMVGVTVSFFGNRLIVFRQTRQLVSLQFASYVVLYGVLALLQGGLMHALVDWSGTSVMFAFGCCVLFQFFTGFAANRHVVFSH